MSLNMTVNYMHIINIIITIHQTVSEVYKLIFIVIIYCTSDNT